MIRSGRASQTQVSFSLKQSIISFCHSQVMETVYASRNLTNFTDQFNVWMNRTSGLALDIRVLSADFSSTFHEVSHVDNDNTKFVSLSNTSTEILQNFCSTPLADYYEIRLIDYQTVDIQKRKDKFVPCPRYDSQLLQLKPTNFSLFCTGNESSLVQLFGNANSNETLRKEDGNKDCYDLKVACGICRDECTKTMQSDPLCNVSEAELNRTSSKKYQFGEHFAFCFECCELQQCSKFGGDCHKYRKQRHCPSKQVLCSKLKQYEIPITPIFPNPDTGDFKCHVHLARGPSFQLQTFLWQEGRIIGEIGKSTQHHSMIFPLKSKQHLFFYY